MLIPVVCAAVIAAGAVAAAKLRYPVAPRGNVVDDYFGTRVADPYRGFETLDSPATRQWVKAENALAQPWLESIPQRAWVKARLTQLWNYERYGVPKKAGGRYFYTRNDGTQNQSVLYVADSLDSPGRVLFDPNSASKDATIALARFEPSPDGKLLAYSLSDGGTDWEIWRFRRVDDGSDLPDELRRVKFWQMSWATDGSGVYYSRYPARADGHGDDAGRPAVYFHRLGDAQERDALVYAVTDHATRAPSADITDDGKLLVISIYEDTRRDGVVLKDISRPDGHVTRLFTVIALSAGFLGNDSGALNVAAAVGTPCVDRRLFASMRCYPSLSTTLAAMNSSRSRIRLLSVGSS